MCMSGQLHPQHNHSRVGVIIIIHFSFLPVKCFMKCKFCGGRSSGYDSVKRILRDPRGAVRWETVRRYRCKDCGRTFRVLTDEMLPFKQYTRDIIEGVVDGLITEWTYGFEDYPCDSTRKRWLAEFAGAIMQKLYGGNYEVY